MLSIARSLFESVCVPVYVGGALKVCLVRSSVGSGRPEHLPSLLSGACGRALRTHLHHGEQDHGAGEQTPVASRAGRDHAERAERDQVCGAARVPEPPRTGQGEAEPVHPRTFLRVSGLRECGRSYYGVSFSM